MGLVFHGCERVGEREGLCATAARERKGDRADGKKTGTVRLGRANGWLKSRYLQTIVVGEPSRRADVLEIGKAHSQADPRAREGQGANIPRGDYQSFSTRICAGQQDDAGGQSVCDGW